MILFLFTIVFVAQLIITAFLVIKLIDIDLIILELDEKLQAEQGIYKCSLYYAKEMTSCYKELVQVAVENFDKKMKKSNYERIKSTIISLILALMPRPYRKIFNNSKWGYKIFKYLSTP